jgi:hypothetical protein
MATGNVNARSVMLSARVPHEIAEPLRAIAGRSGVPLGRLVVAILRATDKATVARIARDAVGNKPIIARNKL